MPKITTEEIANVVNKLGEAKTYAREAHRLSNLLKDHDDEIRVNLRYCYESTVAAQKIMEADPQAA